MLQCPSLTCGGAPGQAGRPAAVAPAGDHAGAGGGEARLALDGDAVPVLVGRPRGSTPKGPRHIWRGTRHICRTENVPFTGQPSQWKIVKPRQLTGSAFRCTPSQVGGALHVPSCVHQTSLDPIRVPTRQWYRTTLR